MEESLPWIKRDGPAEIMGSLFIIPLSTPQRTQFVRGVGHANPDSVAYMNWATGQTSWGVHGCDGCCGPVPEEQKRSRWVETEHGPALVEAEPGWPPQDGGY